MIIPVCLLLKLFPGLKRPVKLQTWNEVTLQQDFLKNKPHLVVVWLLLEVELIHVLAEGIQELRLLTAKLLWLGQDLVPSNVVKLVADGLLVVYPLDVGVDAEDEEVYQRDEVVTAALGHLTEGVLA